MINFPKKQNYKKLPALLKIQKYIPINKAEINSIIFIFFVFVSVHYKASFNSYKT